MCDQGLSLFVTVCFCHFSLLHTFCQLSSSFRRRKCCYSKVGVMRHNLLPDLGLLLLPEVVQSAISHALHAKQRNGCEESTATKQNTRCAFMYATRAVHATYPLANLALQGKGGVGAVVNAVLVQVRDIELDRAVVIGCDQLVGPRAAEGRDCGSERSTRVAGTAKSGKLLPPLLHAQRYANCVDTSVPASTVLIKHPDDLLRPP